MKRRCLSGARSPSRPTSLPSPGVSIEPVASTSMMASHVPPLGRAMESPLEGMESPTLRLRAEHHVHIHFAGVVDREPLLLRQFLSGAGVHDARFPVVAYGDRHPSRFQPAP